jgi:hypothetical protein
MIEEIKQYLRDEIKRQESNWGEDDHSVTVGIILDEIEYIEKGWKERTEEFKARVASDSYVCNAGFWTTDYYLELEGTHDTFEDIIMKHNGKRMKVTIEVLEDDKNE